MNGLKGNFKFIIFMGLIITCFFIRLVFMVKNTSIAGPTIRIMHEMFAQLARFVLVWISVIIYFATISQLLWGKDPHFRTFNTSFTHMLYTAFSGYDPGWFSALEMSKQVWAVYYMQLFLVINVLLLMNYVVAIMTDRYAALQEARLGLLHDD